MTFLILFAVYLFAIDDRSQTSEELNLLKFLSFFVIFFFSFSIYHFTVAIKCFVIIYSCSILLCQLYWSYIFCYKVCQILLFSHWLPAIGIRAKEKHTISKTLVFPIWNIRDKPAFLFSIFFRHLVSYQTNLTPILYVI